MVSEPLCWRLSVSHTRFTRAMNSGNSPKITPQSQDRDERTRGNRLGASEAPPPPATPVRQGCVGGGQANRRRCAHETGIWSPLHPMFFPAASA